MNNFPAQHKRKISWKEVTKSHPCRVCGKTGWCSWSPDDEDIAICRRSAEGGGERVLSKRDRNGGEFWVHLWGARAAPKQGRVPPSVTPTGVGAEQAAPQILDRVYRALHQACGLDLAHVAALHRRGLKLARYELHARGFFSVGRSRLNAVRQLIQAGLEKHFPSVPGFVLKMDSNGQRCWSFGGRGGLALLVRNARGQAVAVIVRSDQPGDGPKYLWCSSKRAGGPGPGSPAHVPLHNGDTSVIRVTEGAVKAEVTTLLSGTLTIGLPGVSAWRQAAPVLRELQAKTVLVAYDADFRTNPNVARGLRALVDNLRNSGFEVRLEVWDPKLGKGIDDLLAAGCQPTVIEGGAVGKCLSEIATKPEDEDEDGPKFALTDPHCLAQEFLKQFDFKAEGETLSGAKLAYWRQCFYRWDIGHWQEWPDDEIRAAISKFCRQEILRKVKKKKKVPATTVTTCNNVMQALRGERLIPSDVQDGTWLPSGEQKRWLSVENGLLDIAALFAGHQQPLQPPDPRWWSMAHLPYKWDIDADCPRWRAFLRKNLQDDNEKIRLLQQYAGYLLVPTTDLQAAMILLGDGNNGKSVILAALTALLGEQNVSAVPLELFGDKFRLVGTLGKLANVVAEIGELDKIAEGLLKSFIAGDRIEFERKYKNPFSSCPTARLLIATNTIPRFIDKTDGIWRRLRIVHLDYQVPARERILGMDKPKFWHDERPGLLNWALAGLLDLQTSGSLIEPASAAQLKEQLRADANPARSFLLDHLVETPGASVAKDTVYQMYRDWCSRTGHTPLAINMFGREVLRLFKTVTSAEITDPSGRRKHAYRNIRIHDQAE